jgi:hypothetical protein
MKIKQVLVFVILICSAGAALADEKYWCLDEASGGYIMDPVREVGNDKSKPQHFMKTRTAVRIDGLNAYLNFQGLGEKKFSCSRVRDDIMQCVGPFSLFVFDKASGKFNLSQLGGHVGDSKESIVLRFGTCKKVDRFI